MGRDNTLVALGRWVAEVEGQHTTAAGVRVMQDVPEGYDSWDAYLTHPEVNDQDSEDTQPEQCSNNESQTSFGNRGREGEES